MKKFLIKEIKKGTRIVAAVFFSALMSFSSVAMGTIEARAEETSDSTNNYGLHNPRIAYNYRDTVIFGHYWQEDTNGDGVADQNDEKQPIVWQVLERYEDGTALVLSDKVLDVKQYNENEDSCLWESSDIRSWLKGNFYNDAFDDAEIDAIKSVTLENLDNSEYGTSGGADTTDNIFLLSIDDMKNISYGYNERWETCDPYRTGKATSFAISNGVKTSVDDTAEWWLRSPGINSGSATYVVSDGFVDYGKGRYICDIGYNVTGYRGIRPAIIINLLSTYVKIGDKVKISVASSEWDTVTFGSYKGYDISWRVLNISGDDAFLLADRILESKDKKYDDSILWKDSPIRKWLNEDFYNDTFDDDEKSMIKSTNVINNGNSYKGIEGGEDTIDKLFLLSLDEIVNIEYGFFNMHSVVSSTRVAKTNDEKDGEWWLRSPSDYQEITARVYDDGYVGDSVFSVFYTIGVGVRPALHIDLSSSAWKKGESVKSGESVPLILSEKKDNDVIFSITTENKNYEFNYQDANSEQGNYVYITVMVYPALTEEYTYSFSDRTANMVWSKKTENPTSDNKGTEIVFKGNTEFSDEMSDTAEFYVEILKTDSDNNKNYGYIKIPIKFIGMNVSEGDKQKNIGNDISDKNTNPVSTIQSVTESVKKAQNITGVKNITKNYSTKKFSIKAKTNGDGKITYTSSNKKVAKISANGKVTLVGIGKTKIIIKAAGTSKYKPAQKTIVLTVKAGKQKITSKVKSKTMEYTNKSFNLGTKVLGKAKVTYKSSNPNVLKVDSKGKVTLTGIGKATITISTKKNKKYAAATKKITINVTAPKLRLNCKALPGKKVSLSWNASPVYDGYYVEIAYDSQFTDTIRGGVGNFNKGRNEAVISGFKTAGTKCYARIRPYSKVNGKEIYYSWSNTATFTVVE